MNLEVFTCRICAEAGRDDYDFCRNCVPLGRHCFDCVMLGCCIRSVFLETSNITNREATSSLPFHKNASRSLGLVLTVMGIVPLVFSFTEGTIICPSTGCPPNVLSTLYWQSAILFFSGIALVVLGIMSILVARRVKRTQWTDAPFPSAPRYRINRELSFLELLLTNSSRCAR